MRILLISGLSLLALTANIAFADELLDRLEIATERLGALQGAFYARRVPALRDKMPSWDWDEEIRDASKCVLDGIEKSKGRRIAEAYVSGIEKTSQKEITTFSQLSDSSSIPPELLGNDQTIIRLMQQCRTMEISAERLKESGFWDEMLKPEVMSKLTQD